MYQGEKTGRDLMFRAEYQTLRKLSIRTYQMYLEDFKTYPRNEAECLIKAIETTHPDVISYKAMPCWKDASLKYLRENVYFTWEGLVQNGRTSPCFFAAVLPY